MSATARDFTSYRFSTVDIPPEQRLSAWQEMVGRTLPRRILSPPWHSNGPFDVEMTGHTLGNAGPGARTGACIVRMAVSAGGSAHRTKELLVDGNDDVVLHIQEAGRRIVSQRGREAMAASSGGLVTSNADTSTIVLPEASRFVSIAVPRKVMLALVPGLEDMLLRPLSPDIGALRLMMTYLSALDDDSALGTPDLRHAFATHVQDLFALAVGATREATEVAQGRGLRAARLRAIKADIARNLGAGVISATALATQQRVTPRYIHKLFESEGTTLSRFVLSQRLARVHRLLGDRRYAHRTIGALAFDAGFGDLSTFNREFRRHYGMTPSDVRAVVRK